jgi:hypothetical protein
MKPLVTKSTLKHPLGGLLSLMAGLVLVSLFFKAWLDVDWSWDTWNYHLPFAARLWGILPETVYTFDSETQLRFSGFPVFAEWCQGALWALFQRVQAANLFSLLVFVGFLEFLKRGFSVPRFASCFALLAIPLVQIHTTLCYVDLPGSVLVAMAVLSAYRFWVQPSGAGTQKDAWMPIVFSLAAIAAGNIKLVYLPLLLLAGGTIFLKLLITTRPTVNNRLRMMAVSFLVMLFMLATPLKNVWQHKNAFYGSQVYIGSWHISEGESYTHDVPRHLENASPAVRWLESVMEPRRSKLFWTHDQHEGTGVFTMKGPSDRLGGFFREYVLFNVGLLMLLIALGKRRIHFQTAGWMLALTIITAFTPMSFQLRYSLYWMILLLAFNLSLIYLPESNFLQQRSILRVLPLASSLAFFGFFITVALATRFLYIIPENRSIDVLKAHIVQQSLASVSPQEHYCIVGVQPFSMLFTSLFNTPYTYSLEGTGWPPKIIDDTQWPPRYHAELLPGNCHH